MRISSLQKTLTGETIIRAFAGLLLITILAKIAGYAEKVLLAYYWGTGDEADVYQVIFTLITALFLITRELVEPGYLDLFTRYQNSDTSRAWNLFNGLFRHIFIIQLLLVALICIFPGQVVYWVAPGFAGEKQIMAISFTRIAALGLLFYSLSALTNITLNALKKFAYPAMGDIVLKSCVIIALILSGGKTGIAVVAWGIVAGCLGRLITHLLQTGRYLSLNRPVLYQEDRAVLLKYMAPLLAGILFSQLTTILGNNWVSHLGKGEIAALGYASKLADLPIVLISYTLTVVAFPHFSRLQANSQAGNARQMLAQINGILLLLFLPLTAFCLLYAPQIIALVYQRGAFDAASGSLTTPAFLVWSAGLVPLALESVQVVYFFSMRQVLAPVLTGIACSLLSILITYAGIGTWGYLAVPIGYILSRFVKTLVLTLLLSQQKQLLFSNHFIFRVLGCTVLYCLFLWGIQYTGITVRFQSLPLLLPVLFLISLLFYLFCLLASKTQRFLPRG
jgi:putative peptidoglycan lipid II flippase